MNGDQELLRWETSFGVACNFKFQIVATIVILTSQVHAQGVLDLYGIVNVLYLKADGNNDGIITQPELNNVYHGFDDNKDGKVTKTEFVNLWMQITHETQEHADAFFYLADINDDNIIDEHDLNPLYQVFDLNGDGQVTANEFAQKWVGIITETPLAVLFERSDADKSNLLTTAEFDNFLKSFDKDGDNLITQTEMEDGWTKAQFGLITASDTLFTNMDLNHNHHIDSSDLSHLFTKYDKNHNHELDILEVVKMADMLPAPPVIG